MPRLHAKHRTEIRYVGPVGESVNEIRISPTADRHQDIEWSHVRTEPATELHSHVDAYGNTVHWFQLVEEHERLVIDSEAIVVTRPSVPRSSLPAEGIARTAEPAYREEFAEFLTASSRVRWVDPVVAFADTLALDEGGAALSWASSLEAEVNRTITYTSGATEVDTPIEDVVRAGRGVCQDMAHVMIAIARHRGVGARYVSGWLNRPGADLPGESHAWTELAIPGVGWVEFDPTHPEPAYEHYVRLATGRDYSDVPPLRGSYVGPETELMEVVVEVTQLG